MKGAPGFALIETLIALALTAMIATAILGLLRFGLDALDRAAARATAAEAAHAADRTFRGLVERMAAEGPALGTADRLVWRGVGRDDDGLWRAAFWRLSAGADGLTLARCAALDAACAPARPLMAGPARLRYAGPDGVLADDWPEGPPPRLVAVETPAGAVAAAPRTSAP